MMTEQEGSTTNATTSSPPPPPMLDIESLRLHLSSWVAQIRSKISIETLRPIPVFLGIRDDAESGNLRLSKSAFLASVPPIQTIPARVHDNCDFFLSNYVLVAVMVALVVSLMHLEMIFLWGMLYGLWLAHAYLIQHSVIVFGIGIHSILTVQQRFYLLFTISTIAIVWACMVPAIIWTGISSVLILSHAILRNPNHRNMDLSQRDDDAAEGVPLVSKV